MWPVQNLQNRAARIVTNSSYDTPLEALIKELKWQTKKEMIRCETATIVFNSFSNLAHKSLSHLFIRNSDRNTINL